MAKKTDNWWRPEGRNPFDFDPTQPLGPQIFAAVWQLGVIFGGPLLGLVTINKYTFLIEGRTLYVVGLSSIAFWFGASFVSPGRARSGSPSSCRQLVGGGGERIGNAVENVGLTVAVAIGGIERFPLGYASISQTGVPRGL